MGQMGYYEYKPAPLKNLLMLALGDIGSVAFFNLTLARTSIGFYQVCKIMCIPTTVLLHFLFQGKTTSMRVTFTLAIMLIGIYIATVTEVAYESVGLIYGGLAIVCTSSAHIFIGHFQDSLQLSPMQLLRHSAPLVAGGMAIMAPFFDDVSKAMSYHFTPTSTTLVLISCAFAVAVNISNFIIIGKTSAVTYQVVGHFKTCLLLVGGYYLFGSYASTANKIGVGLAWVGMIAYTEVKRREGLEQASATKDKEREKDKDRLQQALPYKAVPMDEFSESESDAGVGHSHGPPRSTV